MFEGGWWEKAEKSVICSKRMSVIQDCSVCHKGNYWYDCTFINLKYGLSKAMLSFLGHLHFSLSEEKKGTIVKSHKGCSARPFREKTKAVLQVSYTRSKETTGVWRLDGKPGKHLKSTLEPPASCSKGKMQQCRHARHIGHIPAAKLSACSPRKGLFPPLHRLHGPVAAFPAQRCGWLWCRTSVFYFACTLTSQFERRNTQGWSSSRQRSRRKRAEQLRSLVPCLRCWTTWSCCFYGSRYFQLTLQWWWHAVAMSPGWAIHGSTSPLFLLRRLASRQPQTLLWTWFSISRTAIPVKRHATVAQIVLRNKMSKQQTAFMLPRASIQQISPAAASLLFRR